MIHHWHQYLAILFVAGNLFAAPSAPIIIEGSDHHLLVDPRGRVCALEIGSDEFSLWDNFSESSLDAQRSANRIFEHFGDVYDFILFIDNVTENGGGGRHFGVRNDIQGIGQSTFDNSASYGSAGQLQSVIHLTQPSTLRGGPSLHEIMHRWGNRLGPIYNSGAHWGFASVGGQLGGWLPGSLVDLGSGRYDADGLNGRTSFGTFANGGNALPYSQIELYIMGLIPTNEVDPIKVAVGAAWEDASQGIFTATAINTVTIGDVTTAEGARTPDTVSSQKNFRTLVVLLTDGPVSEATWDQMDADAAAFSLAGDNGSTIYNFWEATGGRATIQMDGLIGELNPGLEALTLSPSTAFTALKIGNDAFTTSDASYTIRNDSAVTIPWTADAPAWLDLDVSSGLLAPAAEVTIQISLNAAGLALNPGRYQDELRLTNTSNGNYSAVPVNASITALAFADDFESGAFSAAWTVSGTGTYRTQVTNLNAPSGTYQALLDDSVSDTENYARNELTLTLDLQDWQDVVLQFDAKEFGDESHGPPAAPFIDGADFDGVAISRSADSNEWYEVQSLRSLGSNFETIAIDLDAAIAALGWSYTDTFQIRFNQYDNFAATSDGIAIDNVQITGTKPSAFDLWAAEKGLTLDVNDAPTDDPDGDGRSNFEEFAFDGNPNSATSDSRSRTAFINIASADYFTLTLAIRDGANFSGASSLAASIHGIDYQIRGSSDLSNWSAAIAEVSPALDTGLPSLNDGWSYRSFRYPTSRANAAKAFLQALASETP
ncbi:MAG: hypothetical protein ACSHX8_11570 [Opitutaceae bacterium]